MSDENAPLACAHCDFVTSKRSLTELIDHAAAAHPDKTFMCNRRDGGPGSSLFRCDCWEKNPNGDLTCTYCGSLSEADFIDIAAHYADGEEGYHFSTTDKGYKFYAHRPGVVNALDGGIKFYLHHVDEAHPDYEKRKGIAHRAMKKHRERFAATGAS
jgi:hypothetical protein